jgi:tripartite-type tricarboxylate transporter receptor subunit TctC
MNPRYRITTLSLALGLAAAVAALATTSPGRAQDWPTRSVTMVVPFTAGTTSDIIARALVDHMSRAIGQPVVIDNRGGAGGNIGGAVLAKAAPDGYTLMLATTGPAATNKLMYKNMSFDPQRDFAPIALIGKAPVIIVARQDGPAKTLEDLIDYARKNPDKLTVGLPGNGTLGHITSELLQSRTGIKLGQTQYRGSTPIITDLLGGHIDLGMDSMAAYVPQVKEGKLRALALAGGKRWASLPDVPTVSESGLPGFEASVWYALLAPAGTPEPIMSKLNAAANDFLRTSQAKEMFEQAGVEAAGGTPADLTKFIAEELQKWDPIIKGANISF